MYVSVLTQQQSYSIMHVTKKFIFNSYEKKKIISLNL